MAKQRTAFRKLEYFTPEWVEECKKKGFDPAGKFVVRHQDVKGKAQREYCERLPNFEGIDFCWMKERFTFNNEH